MANVDFEDSIWPDATAAGVQRKARNHAIAMGAMDSVPTAHVDYNGALMYVPGATLVQDKFPLGYKNNADAAALGYVNPAFAAYGVGLSGQFVYQSAAFTLTNGTSAQNLFTAANDTFAAEANTTYLIDAYISLTTGATDHITSLSFDAGTATFTSFNYVSNAASSAANTLAAPQSKEVEVSTVIAICATSTAVRTRIWLKGSMQVNAAGTFIPRVTFSADPTGTLTTNIGSYFLLVPVGTKTVVSSGERWS